MTKESWFDSRQVQDISPSFINFKPAVEPTQPPVRWVPDGEGGDFFSGGKAAVAWRWHLLVPRFRMAGAVYLLPRAFMASWGTTLRITSIITPEKRKTFACRHNFQAPLRTASDSRCSAVICLEGMRKTADSLSERPVFGLRLKPHAFWMRIRVANHSTVVFVLWVPERCSADDRFSLYPGSNWSEQPAVLRLSPLVVWSFGMPSFSPIMTRCSVSTCFYGVVMTAAIRAIPSIPTRSHPRLAIWAPHIPCLSFPPSFYSEPLSRDIRKDLPQSSTKFLIHNGHFVMSGTGIRPANAAVFLSYRTA
jgi:hypothetical protein